MSQLCPICDSQLVVKAPAISVAEIFERWKTMHAFSEKVIREHLRQSTTTNLYSCPNCLLEIYLPNVIGTENFYQELQEDVSLAYYREDKWDFDEALKDVKGCTSIIEVGCGPGSFLARAKPYVINLCGTEYNKAALELARRKGLDVFGMDYDAKSLEASFDAVFTFHVLEHVPDPLSFIKEISLFARPGGKICVSVPNHDGPMKNIGDALLNIPPHHATHWRLKTFNVLANKLNFRILKVAYEPLLLENYDYYAHYWLSGVTSDKTKFQRRVKKIISIIMTMFFKSLMQIGLKRFPLLRGQAIYIVMIKEKVH